jgi:hypothetical protein
MQTVVSPDCALMPLRMCRSRELDRAKVTPQAKVIGNDPNARKQHHQ